MPHNLIINFRYEPPPPTAEMLAYEEERKSQIVDYGHGRSGHHDGKSIVSSLAR